MHNEGKLVEASFIFSTHISELPTTTFHRDGKLTPTSFPPITSTSMLAITTLNYEVKLKPTIRKVSASYPSF
jgi:hypothetical protein